MNNRANNQTKVNGFLTSVLNFLDKLMPLLESWISERHRVRLTGLSSVQIKD